MALINCKDCGKEVSTEAKACPHCGAKPPKTPSKHGFPIAAILIIGIIAWLNHQASIPESPEARAEREERATQARAECAKALLGGARVTGYVDKQAYDKVVADKCAGFDIPK